MGSIMTPAYGKDVTKEIRSFARVQEGECQLVIPAALNEEFGDPAFGVWKVRVYTL